MCENIHLKKKFDRFQIFCISDSRKLFTPILIENKPHINIIICIGLTHTSTWLRMNSDRKADEDGAHGAHGVEGDLLSSSARVPQSRRLWPKSHGPL